MRPIDADVLLKKFSAECEYSDDCKKTEPCITCIINGCPTLDVEPIKHGQWIEKKLSCMKWIPNESDGITAKETTIEDMTEKKCSICQRWVIKFTHHIEMNYCPNCGARMDGENT